MRSTGRGITEGGPSWRGRWGRRDSSTGWVEVSKGKVGRVEGSKRLVLRRGERLGGEDGTRGTVRRGWVEVDKGMVGRVEGAERLVLRRGERLRGEDGAGGKVRRGWVEVGKGKVGRVEDVERQ